MRAALPAVLLSLTASLAAQEPGEPRFRIGLGLGSGAFDYDTERSNLDDRTDAGMFRLLFEGTSKKGIGGGIRLDSFVSDDDMFVGAGFPATEATGVSVFSHFTYRVQSHRFAMPLRAGLLLDQLTLDEVASDTELTFTSFGPYFEIAPEIVLARGGKTQWSLFGEFGIGFGGTDIDLGDNEPEYDSFTSFSGLELGTRLQLGPIELGLSYVARWKWMDESDPEGGLVVLAYDADFQGVLLGVAVVF